MYVGRRGHGSFEEEEEEGGNVFLRSVRICKTCGFSCKSAVAMCLYSATIWRTATSLIPASLLANVLKTRETMLVRNISIHDMADVGGDSASMCPKRRMRKTGSYSPSSSSPLVLLGKRWESNSKQRHLGKFKHVLNTTPASRLRTASSALPDSSPLPAADHLPNN